MQSKTFTADSAEAVIAAVNAWLAGEKGIAIRKTETHPPQPQPGERIEFSIWYDQEATS